MVNLYDFLMLLEFDYNIYFRTKNNDSYRLLNFDEKQRYSLCYVLSFYISVDFVSREPVIYIKLEY